MTRLPPDIMGLQHQSTKIDNRPPPSEDEASRRLARLEKLAEKFGDPYRTVTFDRTHAAAEVKKQFADLKPGDKTDKTVHVAGRIMAIRNDGMFIDILDDSDRLQVFNDTKHAKPERKELLKLLDLGDIIGVKGLVRRTPRGEITVDAAEIQLLAKALEPPPEKFHGLKDVDHRFRRREQDLVATPRTREVLRARYKMVAAIRRFLDDKGFIEAETPVLQTLAGGALAKPFVTHHNALDIPLYLRIATELHLKRLVIGGLSDKVYEIGRLFRNEGLSPRHNPEFTTIELYQAYVDFTAMIEMTEAIIQHVAMTLHGTTKIKFADVELDFTPPFPRKSMLDLVKEHAGLDLGAIADPEQARAAAAKIGVATEPGTSWGQVVEAVFGEKVEDKLIQPIHVIDLPKEISPLAKAWPDRPHVAQRFETYVNGWEIANAFSELNDPREQRARFLEQAEQKRKPDEPPHPIDEEFLTAMAFGMPPMGGLGIGLDRLGMLMTDSQSIREVIAFPTMKPLD
ncbi:MAG TPA: lysine--tRNA ligase [Alphaproteobacteria bacterium]|nr:lysine--tRNA ligase [Alphaproteobacteria bacterium]